jgi:hypothetical protein
VGRLPHITASIRTAPSIKVHAACPLSVGGKLVSSNPSYRVMLDSLKVEFPITLSELPLCFIRVVEESSCSLLIWQSAMVNLDSTRNSEDRKQIEDY